MLNPSFTRSEYWLLETAVSMGIPVSPLLLSDQLELAFNKPGHGNNRSQLEAEFKSLAERRFIGFSDGDENRAATIKDVPAGLDGVNELYYRLTSDGGANWEAFAAPDWNKFVKHSYSYEDGSECHEVVAVDKSRLRRVFDGLHYIGVNPKPETIVWTELKPFSATYWKELPEGFRVAFRTTPRNSAFDWDAVPPSYYSIYRSSWYTWGR
jgi:hypothetical protein